MHVVRPQIGQTPRLHPSVGKRISLDFSRVPIDPSASHLADLRQEASTWARGDKKFSKNRSACAS